MFDDHELKNEVKSEEKEELHVKLTEKIKKKTGKTNVKIRHVAAGYAHSIAVDEDGDLYSWGFNIKG